MMSNIVISNQKTNPPIRWTAVVQLVLSILGALLLFGAAAVIILVNAIQYFSPGNISTDLTQSFMIATSLAFAGILVLPSAWYSWKSIANPEAEAAQKTERRGVGLLLTIVVVVLVLGALLLGNWIFQNSQLSWLFLPPLNIIATGLPALWLIYIGVHGLPLGSQRRRWGVFATGLVLSPLVILILEVIVLIGMGILAILWATVDPSLSSQLNILVIRLQNSYADPEAVLRILFPLLLNPGILVILFSSISVIIPMIEETLKPLGVWFLAGQKLTPANGFVYGVLSGAGFGLFENLGNTSGSGEAWAILASTRISTLLIHCFTAGLVGWALASAWSERRYLRLGVSFILAVIVHGLWNGMAVLSAAASLPELTRIAIPTSLERLGNLSDIGIIVLGALTLVLYIGFNAVLQRNLPAPRSPFSAGGEPPGPGSESTQPPQAGEPSQVIGNVTKAPESNSHDLPTREDQPTLGENNA